MTYFWKAVEQRRIAKHSQMPKLVREKTQKIELRVTPETKILTLKMAQDDDITVTKFLEGLIEREYNRRARRDSKKTG